MSWLLRKRVNPSNPAGTGAAARIQDGLWGNGRPMLPGVIGSPVYHYHEGDLFTPGAMNYVFESPFELPIVTVQGSGTPFPSNNFDPRQPMPFFAPPNVVSNGMGGLFAGQIITQPLSYGNEQGGA